jgi:hypothetical protein
MEMPDLTRKPRFTSVAQGICDMKLVCSLLAMGLLLGGCSSSGMLNSMGMGSSPEPASSSNIQVGNNLAMPPDLQLRPPGTAPAAPAVSAKTYQEPAVASAEPSESLYSDAPAPATKAPPRDVYAQYGISKVKADGTEKTKGELQAELKVAMLKKKRETQPGYGTIRNIGNIFSDG